jgi:lysophospholipase L1-like esterase
LVAVRVGTDAGPFPSPAPPMKLLPLALLVLAACLITAAPAVAAKPIYYLSLGDSLSVGIQPGPATNPGQEKASAQTDDGYSDQLYARAKRIDPNLKLVKAGCSGATTQNFLHGGINVTGLGPCTPSTPVPGKLYKSTSTATSQMRFAQDFIRAHKGQIAFVTVNIGPNNLDSCLNGTQIDFACVTAGTAAIKRDLATIGHNLRRAAGPNVPIVGTTLYDPFLGLYLQGGDLAGAAQASQALAQSINETIVIPAWKKNKVRVARVDEAFGTYAPFDQTVQTADLGTVPVAVFNICKFTWYCTQPPAGPNIHPNRTGYKLIADALYQQLRVAS